MNIPDMITEGHRASVTMLSARSICRTFSYSIQHVVRNISLYPEESLRFLDWFLDISVQSRVPSPECRVPQIVPWEDLGSWTRILFSFFRFDPTGCVWMFFRTPHILTIVSSWYYFFPVKKETAQPQLIFLWEIKIKIALRDISHLQRRLTRSLILKLGRVSLKKQFSSQLEATTWYAVTSSDSVDIERYVPQEFRSLNPKQTITMNTLDFLTHRGQKFSRRPRSRRCKLPWPVVRPRRRSGIRERWGKRLTLKSSSTRMAGTDSKPKCQRWSLWLLPPLLSVWRSTHLLPAPPANFLLR